MNSFSQTKGISSKENGSIDKVKIFKDAKQGGMMFKNLRMVMSLPDLRRQILYTLGIFLVARLAVYLPLPSPPVDLSPLFDNNPFLSLLNVFTGGAAAKYSVLALGIYPYLVAKYGLPIFLSELYDDRMSEGASGRQQWLQNERYATIGLAILMGGVYLYIVSRLGFNLHLTPITTVSNIAALTAGSMFFLWLADLLGTSGLGRMDSLIAANIMAITPQYLLSKELISITNWGFRLIMIILVIIVTIILTEGLYRVPVQYGRRVRGRKVYEGVKPFIPIKVNTSEMMPIFILLAMFGSMHLGVLLLKNAEIAWINIFVRIGEWLTNTSGLSFWLPFWGFGTAFKFAYGRMKLNSFNLSQTLQQTGGYIPGKRPGKLTERYFQIIYSRIGLFEPVVTMLLIMLPALLCILLHWPSEWVLMLIPIMYLPSVIIGWMRRLEAQLLTRTYKGSIV